MASPSQPLDPSTLVADLDILSLDDTKHSLHSRVNNNSSSSKLLDQPLELTWKIMSHLSEVDKILLSQTCRAMHHNVFAFRPLPPGEYLHKRDRFKLLERLSDDLPDQYACNQCMKLHDINLLNAPSTFYVTQLSKPCVSNQKVMSFGTEWREYCLTSLHVELALRYWRLGRVQHQYYRRLMKPFSSPSHRKTREEMYISPRIVDGRFILYSWRKFQFSDDYPYKRYPLIDWAGACEHNRPREPIESPLALSEPRIMGTQVWHPDNTDLVREFSCKSCPTDWEIRVDPPNHCLVIQDWRDLGNRQCGPHCDWSARINQRHPGCIVDRPFRSVRNKYECAQ